MECSGLSTVVGHNPLHLSVSGSWELTGVRGHAARIVGLGTGYCYQNSSNYGNTWLAFMGSSSGKELCNGGYREIRLDWVLSEKETTDSLELGLAQSKSCYRR